MPGKGPKADMPVEGRHGGTFANFWDYSVDLHADIPTSDAAGTRVLFDRAALWGVFIGKEFEGASTKINVWLSALFACFITGLLLIIYAGA